MITRDDNPAEAREESLIYKDPWHPKLSTDHSYLYSFPNNSLPQQFRIILKGLDSGNSVLVGFCIPHGASEDQMNFKGNPKPLEFETYEDLLQDRSGSGYFWDKEIGAIFRRFQVDEPRDPESRLACVGGPYSCPTFFINSLSGANGDTDCTKRAYPKYSKSLNL